MSQLLHSKMIAGLQLPTRAEAYANFDPLRSWEFWGPNPFNDGLNSFTWSVSMKAVVSTGIVGTGLGYWLNKPEIGQMAWLCGGGLIGLAFLVGEVFPRLARIPNIPIKINNTVGFHRAYNVLASLGIDRTAVNLSSTDKHRISFLLGHSGNRSRIRFQEDILEWLNAVCDHRTITEIIAGMLSPTIVERISSRHPLIEVAAGFIKGMEEPAKTESLELLATLNPPMAENIRGILNRGMTWLGG